MWWQVLRTRGAVLSSGVGFVNLGSGGDRMVAGWTAAGPTGEAASVTPALPRGKPEPDRPPPDRPQGCQARARQEPRPLWAPVGWPQILSGRESAGTFGCSRGVPSADRRAIENRVPDPAPVAAEAPAPAVTNPPGQSCKALIFKTLRSKPTS